MLGICPECRARHSDATKKQLYECNLCKTFFCETHLEPRLVFCSARFLAIRIKDLQYRREVEADMSKDYAHPCRPYTEKRVYEMAVERTWRVAMFDRLLGRRLPELPADLKLELEAEIRREAQSRPQLRPTDTKEEIVTAELVSPQKRSRAAIITVIFLFFVIVFLLYITAMG